MALQYVFHISDIHIRNGDETVSRYREYDAVFNNLFVSLKSKTKDLKKTEFIIVITGDIFHNKNVIGNYGLALYKKLIKNLVAIGRTIVLHGNHDRNQSEAEQPSLVSTTIEMDDLMLLDATTSFVIDGVGFSYVSIDDTLDCQKTCGRIKKLPPFPPIPEASIRHSVALFHGTFANVRLYNGTEVQDTQDPYPFEWISGFNFAILGDIHLRQTGMHGKTLWGYSGSLVQQNYGEDVINHGYMIWDLDTKKVEEVNVYNPTGFINLRETNGEVCIRIRGKYDKKLSEFIEENADFFPKKVEARLYSNVSAIALADVFKQYGITSSVVSNRAITNDQNAPNTQDSPDGLDIRINKESILQYFRSHLADPQYDTLSRIVSDANCLLFDVSMFDDQLQAECHKKNKEISALIADCNSDAKEERRPFTIRYLEWSNMYCYEGKNWIDLSKIESSTFMIAGANGTGKSAIYDILTYSVWGECTPSRNNGVSGMINHTCSSAYTIVDIEINAQIYRIHRYAGKNPQINRSSIYSHEDLVVPMKKGNACKEMVTKLFGTLEEFLSSSMITQCVDYDILRLGYKDCVALIDKAINIDYIYNFFSLLKCCINKYKDVKKSIEGKKSVYEKILIETNVVSQADIDTLNQSKLSATHLITALEDEINAIPIDTKDPANKMLIGTDYEKMISDLGNLQIKTEQEHKEISANIAELSLLFKDEKDVRGLATLHDNSRVIKNVAKPCEYYVISAEEDALKLFKRPDTSKYPQPISDLHEILEGLKERSAVLDADLNALIERKPPVATPPIRPLHVLQGEIEKLGGMQVLHKHVPTTNCALLSSIISYPEYVRASGTLLSTEERIVLCRTEIGELDTRLNTLYTQHRMIEAVIRPQQELPDGFTHTPIDHEQLARSIEEDTQVLECFYRGVDTIYQIEQDLDRLKKELAVFNKEDYEYNPHCSYCCKRPWVSRIRELNTEIEATQERLGEAMEDVYDSTPHDYLEVFTRNEENINALTTNDLYSRWQEYNAFEQKTEKVTNEISTCVTRKEGLSNELQALDKQRIQALHKIATFDSCCKELLSAHSNAIAYDDYNSWLLSYSKAKEDKQSTDREITDLALHVEYHNNVKPRQENLARLQGAYSEWRDNEQNRRSLQARQLCNLKDMASDYETLKLCKERKKKQEDFIKKQVKLTTLEDKRRELNVLNEKITKAMTVASYYNDYTGKLDDLNRLLKHIEGTIDVLCTISSRFKEYRIELYDKYILKNIVSKANKLLCFLCHEDSKSFKIGYMLTEVKDIIHINWLVKTRYDHAGSVSEANDTNESVISAHQASGFQHFAMSIALRMSIFNNKRCDQMFIDEGFTSCDRKNLSIVPSFLKSLLKIFNSVVLVSHIDVIQESIDNVSNIAFNSGKETSCIQYGDHVKSCLQHAS